MPSVRGSVIGRCLRRLWQALVTFGTYWVYIPPTPSPPEPRGTPPHHPERVCPEVPLTPVERAIQEELRDLADGPGTPYGPRTPYGPGTERGPGPGNGTG